MPARAVRGGWPAIVVGALVALTACGSGEAADSVVTVVQNVTVAPPVTETPTITQPPSTASPEPPVPTEPEEPSESPTTEESPEPSEPSQSSESSAPPETSATSETDRVRAELVVRPPTEADAEVPGPDGGEPCSADPSYFDEDTTGMAAEAAEGWDIAVKAASEEGVVLCLHDGKRSRAQQEAIRDNYVELYGEDVADQLVLPWQKSAHISGYAVDVHPAAAFSWLQATNGELGWCRIYDNEPWHFEFAEEYRVGCPKRLPEPQR